MQGQEGGADVDNEGMRYNKRKIPLREKMTITWYSSDSRVVVWLCIMLGQQAVNARDNDSKLRDVKLVCYCNNNHVLSISSSQDDIGIYDRWIQRENQQW